MSAEVTEPGSFLSVSAVAAATTGEEDGILCNRSAVTTLGPVVLKSDVSRGHIGAPQDEQASTETRPAPPLPPPLPEPGRPSPPLAIVLTKLRLLIAAVAVMIVSPVPEIVLPLPLIVILLDTAGGLAL